MESELTIQGQLVQNLYEEYCHERFLVNRKYQRKLVWSYRRKKKSY
ncbi:MAG: hypothetical protein IJT36_07840 [Alphaproteobacteria bacterium]|nr:hypothetical protein [Alphaproteobacteria bacterium]